MDLVLCSYNIHAGIGRDRAFDAHRVLAVLREVGADVVALQEVERRAVDGVDFPSFLAHALDCHLALGPTLLRETREYGNALLSRLPVREVRRLDLSVPGREPRGAIDALLDARGVPFRVIAAHLGLRPSERRAQVRALLATIEAHDRGAVTALAGDLNEWFLWGRPLRWLARSLPAGRALATFPSGRPAIALDRIRVRPAGALRGTRVHASPTARAASDHLPVVSTIRLAD